MVVNNINQAIKIVKQYIPDGEIQQVAEYKNLYLLIVYTPDLYEGQMDAFYSVNKKTGQFSDFGYLEDGVFEDVMNLFKRTPLYKDTVSDA